MALELTSISLQWSIHCYFSPYFPFLSLGRIRRLNPFLHILTISSVTLGQQSLTFLAPRTNFLGDRFFTDWGLGMEIVWGWFQGITFIVYFISIIITSALPQIIRHQILEVGDLQGREGIFCFFVCLFDFVLFQYLQSAF